MLVFLWAIIFANFLNADNIVDSTQVESKNAQIKRLERNARVFDNYTKYYTKRNYEKPFSSEAHDYKDSVEKSGTSIRQKPKVYKKLLKTPKPKVVIIIDDIANPAQLGALQSIGLKLTPSIFPIAQSNSKMLDMVARLEFFMVHLPLEALTYNDEMDTIKLNDSAESIAKKIAHIKQTMPNAQYLNNHTGSKFTASKANMELLLRVLDAYNISFVDSRTTPNTTLPAIAQEQNRLILYRDIFVDNALDSASLNAQINEGVKIAKERGYAILIAHPHKETLNALSHAKNTSLREVDVIYLNELDSALKRANIRQYAKSKLLAK